MEESISLTYCSDNIQVRNDTQNLTKSKQTVWKSFSYHNVWSFFFLVFVWQRIEGYNFFTKFQTDLGKRCTHTMILFRSSESFKFQVHVNKA